MSDILTNLSPQIILILITTLLSVILALLTVNKVRKDYKDSINTNAEFFLRQIEKQTGNINAKNVTANANQNNNSDQNDTDNQNNTDNKVANEPMLISSKSYFEITMEELYDKRRFDIYLKKVSFILAVVMSIIGTVTLFVGIIVCLFTDKDIGWISTTSGVIVEIVASIYFWLVNRTMKEVTENSDQLEKKEDITIAIKLIDKIDDINLKNETFKSVIEKLLSNI